MSGRTVILLIFVIGLLLIQLAGIRPSLASQDNRGVLVPDAKTVAINAQNVRDGQIYFLVKQNPSKLNDNDLLFQSTNSTFYINASMEDLKKPNANQHLLMAKVTKNGPIKIVTLANLGYAGIRSMQSPSGNTDFFLLTQKGKLDKIVKVDYKPAFPRLKEDMVKNKKPLVSENDEA